MLLTHVFHPDVIKTPLESVDKTELFEEMVDLYVRHDDSIGRDAILSALWARENKMSTAIRDGIALPHAKIPSLAEPRGIIGISKKGLLYDEGTSSLIHFVFMLLSTPTASDLHLSILSSINILLGNSEFLHGLLEKSSPNEIYRLLEEYEVSMLEI